MKPDIGDYGLAAPNSAPNYFDSIVFSTSSVPAPSALRLFSICILFLGWAMKRPNPRWI
jgi:hypothetical protein